MGDRAVHTAQLQKRQHNFLSTWLFQFRQQFIQSGDLLILWGMYHHHGAAHEAEHAAQLSQQVEPFSKQIRRQDGTAWDSKITSAGALKSFKEGTSVKNMVKNAFM